MKALLLLLCGQASVECGFSVNKQVEMGNLTEDTFVAKCLICDHVISVGGLKNIDISNKALLLAASSARRSTWTTLKVNSINGISYYLNKS